MDDNKRTIYDRFKDTVNAYMFHDPNAQVNAAWDRVRKTKDVDEKTFQMFQESAEAGHPFACFNLGVCYENGTGGVEKDLEQAYNWYRKGATSGDANAWVALARMFDKGLYVDKDPKEAAMWLERAAAKGHTIGLIGMGEKYSTGNGVEKDPARALEMFQEAHKKDQRIASYLLGEAIGDGIGCEKDYQKSFELFQEASKNGFTPATFNVGMMLEMGLGCEQDEKKGFELIKQAADEGFPDAMYRTAFHYWEGTAPTGKSPELAFSYFKQAADKDFPPACVEVGICYENGSGTEKSPEEAFKYYEKGLKFGYHAAVVCLAVCYMAGIGCERDEAKAAALLEAGVKMGNSRAYYLLGTLILRNQPYDERGLNLVMVSASNRYSRAALFLGGFFLEHHDAGPDPARAEYYYRLAVSENDLEAAFELADLLDTEENRENEKIQKEIRELYKRSADEGNHPLAAYRLALAYRRENEEAAKAGELEAPHDAYQDIHYMLIAAHGGVPEAAEEIAERLFWGDQTNIHLRKACGFYGYCADELMNDDYAAKAAFTRIMINCRENFLRIGCYDKKGRQIDLISDDDTHEEHQKTREAFDKLTELAEKKNTTAKIYLPLAKALFFGSRLSSDEDQALLSFIEEQPDSREVKFVFGLLMAYLHPEEIQDTIETLQSAEIDYGADNVNYILGNLYYSLAHGGRKKRKLDVLVSDDCVKPEEIIVGKKNQPAQARKHGDRPRLVRKARNTKSYLLLTARAYYQHAYVRSEVQDLDRCNQCNREARIPGVIGALLMINLLLPFVLGCFYFLKSGIGVDYSQVDMNWKKCLDFVLKCMSYTIAGECILFGVIVLIAIGFRERGASKSKKIDGNQYVR